MARPRRQIRYNATTAFFGPIVFKHRLTSLLAIGKRGAIMSIMLGALAACASMPAGPQQPPSNSVARAPIRFLLTFDDGPAAASSDNPTVHILEVLAHNPYQDGIKAVFFTQTRAWHGGGTAVGRQLIRREYDEGHLVAFHSATLFHSNHRFMSQADLDASLQNGVDDLTGVTGIAPTLVRPPFWAYDAATMPEVDGATPVVVTFHDVNTYSSRHIEEYMAILLDVAKELDVPLAAQPFYTDRAALERAALASTVHTGDVRPQLPGIWNWLWQ